MQQVQSRLYTQVWSRLYVLVFLAYFLWQKWSIRSLMYRSLLIAMLVIIVNMQLLTSSPSNLMLRSSYLHENHAVAVEGPGSCC